MATATFRAAAAVNVFGLLAFFGGGGATAKVAKTVEPLIVVGMTLLKVGSEKKSYAITSNLI